ncbi:MAG: hypothetical protein ACYDAR_22110 [Thermomicrobiales bacterium]
MMDEQRALALSRLYIEERIAAAEKEHLLRTVGTRRAYFAVCAAWVGSGLVHIGRRLEAFGGATRAKAGFELRRAA